STSLAGSPSARAAGTASSAIIAARTSARFIRRRLSGGRSRESTRPRPQRARGGLPGAGCGSEPASSSCLVDVENVEGVPAGQLNLERESPAADYHERGGRMLVAAAAHV